MRADLIWLIEGSSPFGPVPTGSKMNEMRLLTPASQMTLSEYSSEPNPQRAGTLLPKICEYRKSTCPPERTLTLSLLIIMPRIPLFPSSGTISSNRVRPSRTSTVGNSMPSDMSFAATTFSPGNKTAICRRLDSVSAFNGPTPSSERNIVVYCASAGGFMAVVMNNKIPDRVMKQIPDRISAIRKWVGFDFIAVDQIARRQLATSFDPFQGATTANL